MLRVTQKINGQKVQHIGDVNALVPPIALCGSPLGSVLTVIDDDLITPTTCLQCNELLGVHAIACLNAQQGTVKSAAEMIIMWRSLSADERASTLYLFRALQRDAKRNCG